MEVNLTQRLQNALDRLAAKGAHYAYLVQIETRWVQWVIRTRYGGHAEV